MFEEIKRLLGENGSREIRLTQSEYDATQHELCQSMAQMLWGDKGLVQSLGPTWFMVVDPRFSAVERTWIKTQKVTATETRTTTMGVMAIDDQGNITTPRMISLEQYAEILGESRHYAKAVRDLDWNKIVAKKGWPTLDMAGPDDKHNDPYKVKNWYEPELLALLEQESSNYFTAKGEPNQLAKTWVKMFQADILGLVMDYAERSNIDQWVLAESGDVVLDRKLVPIDVPVVHAEVEYLDRALLYRTILRANTIKIIGQLVGPTFVKQIEGVELTEWDKDEILREVFAQKYEELYKALPKVMSIIANAKTATFEERTSKLTSGVKAIADKIQAELASGERLPLDLMDGDVEVANEEALQFAKISHSENLVALFYVLVQAESMVKDYPMFQEIIDLVQPVLNTAEDIEQTVFEGLCEQIQAVADKAIQDPGVCEEGDSDGK